MEAQLLVIEVVRHDTGHAELRLTGDLDFDSAPELVDAVAALRREGFEQFVIDLTGVSMCDSSGLSAFVIAHRGGSVPLRLVGVNATLHQLLVRTGLAELLELPPAIGDRDTQAAG
ncbi:MULTISPECIES: STAS domain-containing protein [unclassified Micromonospora]|uniref:STAS domain-containing protein n=1 Tax=unclassified Micromonospora TaxID=2617518 RepID=UPI0022B5F1AC|nr:MULTISPECIES: STAS domain-containing protein [unclassified Micromonospora]MCZ7422403.1 STAS domain-containing protein [Verrucosispora sp. WMMA2121]WBB90153.1 STAS domain-containing protein [Verrucosispora sp. WMMC514]